MQGRRHNAHHKPILTKRNENRGSMSKEVQRTGGRSESLLVSKPHPFLESSWGSSSSQRRTLKQTSRGPQQAASPEESAIEDPSYQPKTKKRGFCSSAYRPETEDVSSLAGPLTNLCGMLCVPDDVGEAWDGVNAGLLG
jgi:hypothetical protein